ncbi:hypothetical protein IKT64_00700, partial [Candidatus Saccharibacteria bacterium]|nr:hypothetical protein [Candidatus Saccharibacteria bacterium]
MRRRDRRIKYVVLGVFAAVVSLTFLLGHLRSDDVDAASLANFDPGFIISDYTMSNYNSMTQAEIQSFLTRKNPCSNSDYDYYLSLTANNPGVYWHWKDGHFVCISEELFGEGTTIGSGRTAAQIIYETAQEYRINPQVLLVLIQKESSLITDPIPNNYDYRAMTGFGCPDTAPCDSKYYGFKNQIRKAAWLFREVLDGGWTNYPVGDNYIQYNPNSGCGGSIVNVKNLATSALYRYTPYQPNAGAIAAGYGTAYCGAYGNRNFYLYFEDWFGGITSESTINEYYKQIGGTESILGESISEEKCGLINGGCFKKYEVGRIYWTKNTGAWDISGRIYDRWFSIGTEWSVLGYPISSEVRNLVGGGAYQKFEHGRIYYKKGIGAWDISGKIYAKWFELGTEWSDLGYPTSGEQKDKNGIVYQQFEHGR